MVEDDFADDIAIAAYVDDAGWHAELLPPRVTADLNTFVAALRQLSASGGVFGLLIIDDDFFVVVRVGGSAIRYLISDVTAATDWPIARGVLSRLGLPVPDEEDDPVQPGGDLSIFADYGFGPMAVAALCDNLDKYPDEMLSDIARTVGFGAQLDAILDNALA